MPDFAYDLPAPDIADKLFSALQAKPQRAWFALVDSAFDYLRDPKKPYPFPEGTVNCFEGVFILEDMPQVAPMIVPLPAKEAKERLKTFVEHCSGRPMLSLLGAKEGTEAEELAKSWRPYHRVYPEDGGNYVLRFADTRVTAILPKFLTPEQWQVYHGKIETWTTVGRNGRLEEIPLNKTDKRPPFKLDLSEKQFAYMVSLNEPDNAYAQLLDQNIIPEEMEGSRFHYLATRILEKADSAGIDQWPDRIALITLVVGTDGKLLGDAEAMQWIQDKAWGEEKMLDAMRHTPCFTRWF